MSNLLDKASIILTPTAYNNGEALCVKPSDGSGDFDFSRNSAATRVNAQGLVENVQILSSNLVQNGDFSEEGVQEVSNGSFSQEGVELVTNGSFDTDSNWNGVNTNGVTISNGSLNFSETTISHNITQGGVVEVGKSYKVTLTISNYVKGSVRIATGATGTASLNYSSNGTFTFYGIADANTVLYIQSRGASGTTLSIDNVSVREVAQNWDLGTGWSIGENKAVCDGTNNADITQVGSIVGKTYKATLSVSENNVGRVNVYIGGTFAGQTTNGATGDFTFYATATDTNLIRIRSNNSFNGSITNISVKEVGQNWDLQTGWSIAENKATFDKTISGPGNINQNNILASGKKYKLTFDTLETNGGNIAYRFGGGYTFILAIQANTTHTVYGVGAGVQFTLRGSDNFIGSITNISVIEITDDTNLPRINYEGFSYQDALGSELITNGGFNDGTNNWTQQLNVNFSVDNGVATIQSTGGNSLIYQYISPSTNSALLKIEFDVVSFSGSYFYISLGGYSTQITQTGKVVIYTTSNRNSNKFDIAPQPTTTIKLNNVSVKEYLGQEVVPGSGCGSWLWEPQSTNLITQSELFSDSIWNKQNSSVVSGFASPSGDLNAFKLINNTTASVNKYIRTIPAATSGVDYSLSVFAKKGEYDKLRVEDGNNSQGAWFDLSNGTFSAVGSSVVAKIEDYGNGWYRCSITKPSITTSIFFVIAGSNSQSLQVGDGTSGIYIWGAMLEQNSFSTSYIPTSGSQVTRNQDVCTNGGSLASINSTEGTLYAEIAALADDLTLRSISLSDGTTNNVATIRYRTNSNRIQVVVFSGGVLQFSNSFDVTNILDFNKVAISYNQSDFNYWVNGVKRANSTSGNTPIGMNKLSFDNGGSHPFFGKTKALAVWKEALSDSELQSLTTI